MNDQYKEILTLNIKKFLGQNKICYKRIETCKMLVED